MNKSLTLLTEKKHALELEINKLKELAENGKTTVSEYAGAVTDLLERIKLYEQEIETLQKESTETVDFITVVVTESAINLQTAKKILEGAFRIIGNIEKTIDERIVKMKEWKKFEQERRVQLHKDMEENARMKSDLEIYAGRLQKKYDELGLGKLIV